MAFELNRLAIFLLVFSVLILILSSFNYINTWDKSKLMGNRDIELPSSAPLSDNIYTDTSNSDELNLYKEINGVMYGFRKVNGDVVFGVMSTDGFKANPDLHVLGKYIDTNVLDFWYDEPNSQVYLLSSVSPTYKSSPIVLTRVNFKNVEYAYLDKDSKTTEKLIVANEWDLISAFDDNEFVLDTILELNDKGLLIEGYLSDGCDLSGRMYRIGLEGSKTDLVVEYGDGCNEKPRKLGYVDGLIYLANAKKSAETDDYFLTNIYTLDPVNNKEKEIYKFEIPTLKTSNYEKQANELAFEECPKDSNSCIYYKYNIESGDFSPVNLNTSNDEAETSNDPQNEVEIYLDNANSNPDTNASE